MTLRRFFSESTPSGDKVSITGEELYHLKIVNRAQKGDQIEIINGKGKLYRGQIIDIIKEEATVKIMDQEFQNKPEIKIVIAPSL